jgi:beta-lactamase class A
LVEPDEHRGRSEVQAGAVNFRAANPERGSMTEVVEQIGQLFRAAGADGYLHAREIGVTGGPEVSVAADSPVVLASVFKIVVAVAYAREVAAGRLDETERTTVGGHDRIGGVGTADCADDVQMSWRDLALFMMTLSDNAATDVIYRRIGQPRSTGSCPTSG